MNSTLTARDWLDKRLSSDQQRLLKRQGFVATGQLPSGQTVYKLRFRDEKRRQRVLYIGADQQLARAVAERLTELQAERVERAELRRSMARSLAAERAGRQLLATVLAQHGYCFHGFAIRRTRGASQIASPTASPCRADGSDNE